MCGMDLSKRHTIAFYSEEGKGKRLRCDYREFKVRAMCEYGIIYDFDIGSASRPAIGDDIT